MPIPILKSCAIDILFVGGWSQFQSKWPKESSDLRCLSSACSTFWPSSEVPKTFIWRSLGQMPRPLAAFSQPLGRSIISSCGQNGCEINSSWASDRCFCWAFAFWKVEINIDRTPQTMWKIWVDLIKPHQTHYFTQFFCLRSAGDLLLEPVDRILGGPPAGERFRSVFFLNVRAGF